MAVSFFLVILLSICAIADSRIIMYGRSSDDKPIELVFDSDNTSLHTQMSEFKAQLASINSNVNALGERVNSLELAGGTCPKGWFKYQDSCYLVGMEAVNFTTAENQCGQQQAHLVHLETQAENVYLKTFLATNFNEIHGLYWIGMTDSETEGVWKMTGTDTTVPFTDWGYGEPQDRSEDPAGQDCAAFNRPADYQWADINCSTRTALVVCEKKMI